jgi:phosphoglucosamine mutase
MERKLFGTDGIRGVANRYPMTGEIAIRLGRALVVTAKKTSHRASPKIVIGKDTRLSGYMLETAIASGICAMGGRVMLVGPLPTPGISFITSSMRADAGVVISASHNPYTDNGIKLFGSDGFKLPDAEELAIEALMENESLADEAPGGDLVGQAIRIDDAVGRYVVELKHTFPKGMTLDGLNIVVDCANGAAYKTAPALFTELGANLTKMAVSPDGKNINEGCGSLHPRLAGEKVKEIGADIGITLDGDADRLILLDEKGTVVDGDAVMALCAVEMIANHTLAKKTLVTTVMSNLGLDLAIEAAGGKTVRTQVGDRYVVETMRKKGYNFGGEQSGHLIFLEHASTGDGMLAALQILAIMLKYQKPLSELAGNIMTRVPQCLLSFQVPQKRPLESLPTVQKAVKQVDAELGKKGRIVLRYSGTENKARVLVEGENQDKINAHAEMLKETIIRALS